MTEAFSNTRPRRSVLYIPGSNKKALNKAKTLNTDAIIFDLEDAVLPDAKNSARDCLIDFLTGAIKDTDYGQRELLVRVNSLQTPWGEADIEAVSKLAIDGLIDGLLVPKVESAQDIQVVVDSLALFGAGAFPIWVMIETPLGVLNVKEIAAHQQLSAIVMGTNDLAKELRVTQSPERSAFMTSFGLCLLAARAFDVDIIDGVYIHVKDNEGLQSVCEQGKALGFDGKSLIHPSQIEICNRMFSPSDEELKQAHTIIDGWHQAKAQGKGVLVVEGRLVEELHVKEAERIVVLAETLRSFSNS